MKRQYDDDDGRTIAEMNVDGMPWHRPKYSENMEKMGIDELSREERRGFYFGVFKAVALVALTFVLVFFLLILLLTHIWA